MTDTPEERQARIAQLQTAALLSVADTIKRAHDIDLVIADTVKRSQDIRFAPLSLVAAGAGAATALIGAGAAVVAAFAALLHYWGPR